MTKMVFGYMKMIFAHFLVRKTNFLPYSTIIPEQDLFLKMMSKLLVLIQKLKLLEIFLILNIIFRNRKNKTS